MYPTWPGAVAQAAVAGGLYGIGLADGPSLCGLALCAVAGWLMGTACADAHTLANDGW